MATGAISANKLEILQIANAVAAEKNIDKPSISLVPIENLRFDPSASWIDPVNTSPGTRLSTLFGRNGPV
jgi:hypothetical protein